MQTTRGQNAMGDEVCLRNKKPVGSKQSSPFASPKSGKGISKSTNKLRRQNSVGMVPQPQKLSN
jgi:hypothetical protein